MNIDPKAERMGRGYIVSQVPGFAYEEHPVTRDADGVWRYPHPTDPKGPRCAVPEGTRIRAYSPGEIAQQERDAAIWSRTVAS